MGGGSEVLVVTYQKVTGPLMANSHPGSYCGQDAYSDMLITGGTNDGTDLHGYRTSQCGNHKGGCPTLTASHEHPIVMGSHKQHSGIAEDVCTTLTAQEKERPVVGTSIVRRLTPLECERLQGFPDGWTDIGEWVDSKGKKHKEADSPRYKALGNSIAIPPWKWVLKRMCANYEREATMASLFDGIGGFPHIWEQLNGKGSCLWASEIEEFPMAVTKMRFGDGE